MELVTESTQAPEKQKAPTAEEVPVATDEIGMVTQSWVMATTTNVAERSRWEMARQESETQRVDVLYPIGNTLRMCLHLMYLVHWCCHLIQGCPIPCHGCRELHRILKSGYQEEFALNSNQCQATTQTLLSLRWVLLLLLLSTILPILIL